MAYVSKMQNKETDMLFKAVLSLETQEDCYRFFDDICTIKEIHAMAQRLQVASLLDARQTFAEIAAETGASSATIARVNKCLHYGADGYVRALKALKKE